tara:strand:+ start:26 stop:532 length:507 start_codon:yes stop_codon:yes gene_type:complete
MANTDFLKPTAVSQTSGATEISWNLDSQPRNVSTGCSTTEPLSSFNSKTTGLLIWSGWDTSVIPSVTSDGSTDTTIDGIEVKVLSSKDSRINDSIIQLAQSGSVIGSNKANADAGENHTYGTSTDVWGTTLAYSDLSTLQVAVKYFSSSIPHKDTAYVYSVQLKIYYT